jgi:hypothetical protein
MSEAQNSITIPVWRSFEWREVSRITQMRGGAIFKTKFVGFCRRERPVQEGEVYSSVSTGPEGEITLSPIVSEDSP